MNLDIEGLPEVRRAMRAYKDDAHKAVQDTVRVTALSVEGDAIKSIERGNKSGKVYTRGGTSHQASAPGEAPASDTGNLTNNIKSIIGLFIAYVGYNQSDDYPEYLEYGTQDMEARPWLTPARDKNRSDFARRMKAALRKVARD